MSFPLKTVLAIAGAGVVATGLKLDGETTSNFPDIDPKVVRQAKKAVLSRTSYKNRNDAAFVLHDEIAKEIKNILLTSK